MDKCSFNFEDVYIKTTSTIAGPKEKKGPLGKYFDFSYKDNYCEQENWEHAEMKMQHDAIELALSKAGLTKKDIDVVIGGDLNNQLGVTNYTLKEYEMPYLGVFAACSTCTEALIISALLIKSGLTNVLTVTSSHNSTSERQFRYPTEYGGQKPNSMTSTSTGAGCSILTSNASIIKVTKATIGRVIDSNLYDSQDMGRTMAQAAADTLFRHLENFQEDITNYDLVITGDLSKYGNKVFCEILKEHGLKTTNVTDAGILLYDANNQNVFAGGSGCGCVTLVSFSYVIDQIKKGVFHRVLIIATGALLNPVMVAQNESIPTIAHAVVLERSYK